MYNTARESHHCNNNNNNSFYYFPMWCGRFTFAVWTSHSPVAMATGFSCSLWGTPWRRRNSWTWLCSVWRTSLPEQTVGHPAYNKTYRTLFRNHHLILLIKLFFKYEDRLTQHLSIIWWYVSTTFSDLIQWPSSGRLKIHTKNVWPRKWPVL